LERDPRSREGSSIRLEQFEARRLPIDEQLHLQLAFKRRDDQRRRTIGEQSEAAAQKSFLIEQGNDWRAVLSQLEPNAIALLCVDESDAAAG